jgi:hemerythrin-like domain-containing protein
MGWRRILEAEHRLMLEVADAADAECAHVELSGVVRRDLVGDILGFFRFFCDGLHDPKEDGLLFSRCRKRGMTEQDEPLEQLLGEHEWCAGRLDALQRELYLLPLDDRTAALAFAADLREYVGVLRCHMETEETQFFDLAQHYLTGDDRERLSEEFESVYYDEVEEGVQAHWQELAHRLLLAERPAQAAAAGPAGKR